MIYAMKMHDLGKRGNGRGNGQIFLAVALAALMLFMPEMALATGTLGNIICAIAVTAQLVGAPIATIVIISLGISAMLGKVSWGMALIVATGIAIVFGAGALIATVKASAGANFVGCANVS